MADIRKFFGSPKANAAHPDDDDEEQPIYRKTGRRRLADSDDEPAKPTATRKPVKSAKLEHEAKPASTSRVQHDSPSTTTSRPTKRERVSSGNEPTATPVAKKRRRLPDALASASPNTKGQSPVASNLPMSGMKVVFTGVFEGFEREDMEVKAKEWGAGVTTAVSGRTNFLVVGHQLEDGRAVEEGKKYQTALEISSGKKKGIVEIIDQSTFFSRFQPSQLSPSRKSVALPSAKPRTPAPLRKSSTDEEYSLWAEKFRPKCLEELVGNGEVVRKLLSWLENWPSGATVGTPKTQGWEVERPAALAVMLSGPPGIGKSTAARLVADLCGYDALELNASDQRNKSAVEQLGDLTSGGVTIDGPSRTKRGVVIFDEMDGLSAGDRGGGQMLAKLIDKTRCPIICICNDRMSTKVRTIANKCYDLKFAKPNKTLVSKAMCRIAESEGIFVDPNAAELLCESVGNDIRQMLNTMQLIGRGRIRNESLTYGEMKKEIGFGLKDAQVMLNPFDVTKRLLTSSEAKKQNINARLDSFFVDYDLIPLLMGDNYINALCHTGTGWGATVKAPPAVTPSKELEYLEKIQKTSASFAIGDKISRKIRRDGFWNLLTDLAIFTCLDPSIRCSGFLTRADFPRWLGRNSTRTKNFRLVNEISILMSNMSSSASPVIIKSGYLDLFYQRACQPLMNGNVEQAVQFIDQYNLTRDHLVDNVPCLRLKSQDKLYEAVDSKTKSALTRTANAQGSKFDISAIKRMTAVAKTPTLLANGDDIAAPLKDELSDFEASEEEDADIKPRAKAKAKPKAKPKAKAKGGKAKPK